MHATVEPSLHSTLQSLLAMQPNVSAPLAGAVLGSFMFPDLPAWIYHSDRQALSASMLKPLLTSPAHFQCALTKTFRKTDAMDFGSLVHLLVLEPQLIESEVALYPGVKDGRDPDYKRFVQNNPNKLVVDEEEFAKARALVPKILERTYKGRALGKYMEESLCENSIYFIDPTTGTLLRIRPDIYHPDVTFDLKTTRCTSAHEFVRHDMVDLDYDLSAFMYTLGRSLYEGNEKAKPFVFIPVSSSAPHSVSAIEAGSTVLQNGAKKYQECLSLYTACTSTGYWPDLGCEITAEIEHWQQFTPASAAWRGR